MKIVSLGCSFTEKYTSKVDRVWPQIVADELSAELMNYGRSGAGNRFAYYKLISHILHFGPPDKVYWLMTEFDRGDFSTSSLHHRLIAIDYEKEPKFQKDVLKSANDAPLANRIKLSKILTEIPIQFIVDSNIIIINQVQEICKAYNIELKIIQGVLPLNYHLSHYAEKEVAKAIISSDYVSLLDFNTIVGFPWMSILGGFSILDKSDWKENYSLSENDPHPSQKGHDYIANLFLNTISTLP